jgi:hypothetical protein
MRDTVFVIGLPSCFELVLMTRSESVSIINCKTEIVRIKTYKIGNAGDALCPRGSGTGGKFLGGRGGGWGGASPPLASGDGPRGVESRERWLSETA